MIRFFALVLIACCGLPSPISAQISPSGPRLPDEQFFGMLDFSRPDLSEVQKAAARSDWPAARHAFAEHIRNRTAPRWLIDPRAFGKDPQYNVAPAEKIMTHRLDSQGIPWQFGEVIDWKFNPTTEKDSKWPHNHEWTWQLNRHSMWLELARAYYATGDEKFVREFVAELKTWVRDCPVPLKAENVAFSRWRTIEAGIRTGTVWPEIFPEVLSARAFDDDALILMVKSFVEHGDYLLKFHTRGNWLTMESNGLCHIGALFPEFKEAKIWRDTAVARLGSELDAQVYPDGAQIELAPGYHGVTIRNFLGPVKLAQDGGLELPKDYLPKMEKMFAYYLFSMQPNRTTAPLNDSSAGSVISYLKEGADLFPKREDFRWAATDGREGKRPNHLSHEFPYAGQFIMRSGWDTSAIWACMDGGPFGFGHQHDDKLSVILTAYGRPLLVEGGTYTYDASEWRHYVISSRAHNLVLVDGLEQNRRKEPKEPYVVKTPLPHVWESNETFDHAAAIYDEGWGSKTERLAKQTRHLFYLKPDLFIIADELESMDGQTHTYETLFHLDAAEAKMDGLKVATQNSGPNISLAAFGAESVKIVKGQKAPVVQGWIPDGSSGYGGVRPIPTAIYRKSSSGTVTLIYVIYPSAGAAEFPVADVKLSGNSLTIHFSDGKEKTIQFQRIKP